MSDEFFGLARDLVSHLQSQGITTLSPIQAATMADLLAGRDVCAAAPTGSGKTLAFAAPLMAQLGKGKPHRPAALVLSPTRELAAQINDVLTGLGRGRDRYSAAVYGGVRQGPQVNHLRRGVDVLVACPGRLEDLMEQGLVQLDNVRITVVDEADRMSDMGFLPTVKRILAKCASDRQTVLVSATLDGASDALARTHMNNPVKHAVAADTEELSRSTHMFWSTSVDDRTGLCADVVRRAGRTIVFTRTKHGADRLADRLGRMGVRAAAIHGGRSQVQRDRSLADFHAGRVHALVATDVAARGIHVDGVACVAHFDLPDSPTDYQHRSGRTARAGASGVVVSLVTPEQRRHAKNVQRAHALGGTTAPDLEALGAAAPEAAPVTYVEREHTDRSRVQGPRRDSRTGSPSAGRPPRSGAQERPTWQAREGGQTRGGARQRTEWQPRDDARGASRQRPASQERSGWQPREGARPARGSQQGSGSSQERSGWQPREGSGTRTGAKQGSGWQPRDGAAARGRAPQGSGSKRPYVRAGR